MDTSPFPSHLRYADPTWLAQSADALKWILTVVDQVSPWDNHTAELLDYCYRVRVASLMRTHAEAAELRQLNKNILRVAHPIREKQLNALNKSYAQRWLAYSDILEDRLSVLGLAIPDSVKKRLHLRSILEWILPRQEVAQKALMEQFNLEEANLSRILTLMEGWELVVRHRHGKEKFVSLGPRASEVLSEFNSLIQPTRADLEQKIAQLENNVRSMLVDTMVKDVQSDKEPAKIVVSNPGSRPEMAAESGGTPFIARAKFRLPSPCTTVTF